MYEMREAFESKGHNSNVLDAESDLMQAIDYHVPEQVGFGIFKTEQVLCVSLLWAAGIDFGSAPARSSSACSDVSDEISPSNMKTQ